MRELFFGKMEYANGDWARIKPMARLDQDKWVALDDAVRSFPDEGLVFVPPAIGLGHARAGTYWTFTREPNARAAAGKDHFIVFEAQPATLIIDLSDQAVEDARVHLYDLGVQVPKGFSEGAVVALRDGMCCAVSLESGTDGVRFARPASIPVNLMAMPSWWLRSGAIDGQRVLPLLLLPQLPTVRKVNWCSDAEFVERVLLRARKHFAQFGAPDGLPGKETLQRIARALESEELLLGTGEDIELEMERLRSQWPRLTSQFRALEAMSDFVLESDVALDLIEKARRDAADAEIERVRPIVEAQVREALRAEIEAANQRLEHVLTATTEAQGRLESTNCELARVELARSDAEARARVAEEKVRQLSEALERQLESLSPREVPFARTFVERLSGVLTGDSTQWIPCSSPPWVTTKTAAAAQPITLDALPDMLKVQADAFGLESLAEVDAFARAGELVFLAGDCTEQALIAYAHCVAAGKLWNMVLDPSVIGLDDLWAAPPDRSPTGLAMAWSHAERHPEAMVVICLRAIDASPAHLWIGPLATALRSQGRPRNLLVFATSLGTTRRDDDSEYPYKAALLNWLVPVRVASKDGDAYQSLDIFTGGERASHALRLAELPASSPHLRPAQVTALARLRGDALGRAVRLAMATAKYADADRLLNEWVTVLNSMPVNVQCPWLGLEELGRLRFQE